MQYWCFVQIDSFEDLIWANNKYNPIGKNKKLKRK